MAEFMVYLMLAVLVFEIAVMIDIDLYKEERYKYMREQERKLKEMFM